MAKKQAQDKTSIGFEDKIWKAADNEDNFDSTSLAPVVGLGHDDHSVGYCLAADDSEMN